MRIAKATHLKRLLPTQDAVLNTFPFCGTFAGAWLSGYQRVQQILAHLQIGSGIAGC